MLGVMHSSLYLSFVCPILLPVPSIFNNNPEAIRKLSLEAQNKTVVAVSKSGAVKAARIASSAAYGVVPPHVESHRERASARRVAPHQEGEVFISDRC